MVTVTNNRLSLDRPIQLADDVYWVGYRDDNGGFSCNPYLIVDGDEAVLIDGGSRPDFSTVMRKILQVGISPGAISHLVYHHYDPDLCGSLPNLEEMIGRTDLIVISKGENNPFIRHYGCRSELQGIDEMALQLILKSGRRLRFIPTPYAHAAGSFMTYDETTGVLFASDLFGSLSLCSNWKLFMEVDQLCQACLQTVPSNGKVVCETAGHPCPFSGIVQFHRQVMPSNAALRLALTAVKSLNPRIIASQHGSILFRQQEIAKTIQILMALQDVGIDGVLQEMACV
ncbi:MAG: MBL fold metallo-hydrolase [Magnetococcales bacterium]|nr:MBL fold metallo-hydrolase [Magnetococcales bacterium]MBF0116010.1 MBL fold metallo-hydrolase [Magnetococcales bacterium]